MTPVPPIPLAHQTMFADLSARCLDAAFDEQFPENGSFVQIEVKQRRYWYYSGYTSARRSDTAKAVQSKLYVGPVDDPQISQRVARFAGIKASYRERRAMVQSLAAAGLPSPTALAGEVTEALWKAGFFRLRGVLIGTLAFQCYAGLLGVRLPGAALMTGDADFAQFHSISQAVGDDMTPMLATLRSVDPSFTPVPHLGSRSLSTRFRTASGFDVEFLTPNRGSDQHQGKPAAMAALGGAGAEPLRFLDFLIHAPVRSVLLHKAGIPVLVPAPERYAVHKLIVAVNRAADQPDRQKARKDLIQAALLLESLELERHLIDVGLAWMEAWDRGPAWHRLLAKGRRVLDPGSLRRLDLAIGAACREEGRAPGTVGGSDEIPLAGSG